MNRSTQPRKFTKTTLAAGYLYRSNIRTTVIERLNAGPFQDIMVAGGKLRRTLIDGTLHAEWNNLPVTTKQLWNQKSKLMKAKQLLLQRVARGFLGRIHARYLRTNKDFMRQLKVIVSSSRHIAWRTRWATVLSNTLQST